MTPAEFKTLMPAFVGVADADIQRWLDRSATYFDVGRWDTLYSDGLVNWVAHKLIMENTAEGLPLVPVISSLAIFKRVGTEQVQYSPEALAAVMAEPMNATYFGREYLELAREVGMGAVAV